MPKSLQKTKGIAVNPAVAVVKIYFLTIKVKP